VPGSAWRDRAASNWMTASGPPRHFAAEQQLRRFGSEADIDFGE